MDCEVRRFEPLNLHDLKVVSSVYLIKKIFPMYGLACLGGSPGTAKTFLQLMMSVHIASGEPFFGHRVKQGNVLYLALEGGEMFKNRLKAIEIEYPELWEKAKYNFNVILSPFNIMNTTDADNLYQTYGRLNPKLIVIDTLNLAMEGGSENSDKDMPKAVQTLKHLQRKFNCLVCPIHHVGKDQTKLYRGHTSLLGALDTGYIITQTEDTYTAEATKQRDMEKGRFYFQLKQIDLGEKDEDGDPMTSAVAVQSGAKLGEREEEVYLWIKENNDKTFTDIRDALKIDDGQLWGILKRLLKKKKIGKTNTKPARYFSDPIV